MRLNPEVLEDTYNFLKCMPPFKSKNLYDADDVVFRVTRHRDCHGLFDDGKKKAKSKTKEKLGSTGKPMPIISISEIHVKTPYQLLETMAHEMVHMTLYVRGHSKWDAHGPSFQAFAKRICAAFGFKLEEF
jgi:hypothetical protein